MITRADEAPKSDIVRYKRHVQNVRIIRKYGIDGLTGSVGIVAKIRRLRILRKNGIVTLSQAIRLFLK